MARLLRRSERSLRLDPHPTQNERFKAGTEFDRTLAAFDGDTIAGVTGICTFTMAVPGGTLPVAGVTAVSVLPSHRRRGILSSLMKRQLNDIHERGESVAALYASESGIYGRFGYGMAAGELRIRIEKPGGGFNRDTPQDPALRIRVVKPAGVRAELERFHASIVDRRPGRYARNAAFWDGVLADEEPDQQGSGSLRCILAEDANGVRGYALFRIKSRWGDDGIPDGTLNLNELEAGDPAAYAALWRDVLDRDLVRRTETSRPVDDPLLGLLLDPASSARAGRTSCGCAWSTCGRRCRPGPTRRRSTWCWRWRTSSARGTPAGGA